MNEKIRTGLRKYKKEESTVHVFRFGKEMGFGIMNEENENSKLMKMLWSFQ